MILQICTGWLKNCALKEAHRMTKHSYATIRIFLTRELLPRLLVTAKLS
jgi:hypothetical protein